MADAIEAAGRAPRAALAPTAAMNDWVRTALWGSEASGASRFAHRSVLLLAVLAGAYQGLLTARANNDTFLHLAMSRELLGGDWPIRDFFDSGLVLMYAISAVAQRLVGYRLLAEALVVALMVAIATFITGRLVLRLAGSAAGALVSQLLILLAAPRPYSYPKLIAYAVMALFWWAYVAKPTLVRALLFGAWTAVAFYFRPDHGVYVAIAVMLAVIVGNGLTLTGLVRISAAGAMALVLVVPWFVFAERTIGFGAYLRSGAAQGQAEEVEMGGHSLPPWPVRRLSDVVLVDTAGAFAPQVSLRWASGSDHALRDAVLARYELTVVKADGDTSSVRMSPAALDRIRELLNEPAVLDTAGIDRATGTIPWSAWPPLQRLAFRYRLFRIRVLPALDRQDRGSDAATVLFHAAPVAAIIVALLFRRRLTGIVTAPRLVAFSLATLVVNVGLIRTPYQVRTVDGVLLPALLAGCGVGALIQFSRSRGVTARALTAVVIVVIGVLAGKSVAVAGEFGSHVAWLAGEWRDAEHLRGAWSDLGQRLVASPPDRYWRDKLPRSPASIQLALYARDCVPVGERLMVLWFAPEIYYYSDRRMAQRHLVFITGWASLEDEQRLTLEKVSRYAPPLVFASDERLDSSTRAVYPGLVDYVHRHYEPVGTVAGDEKYLILARRDRAPVRQYGDQHWPCYARSS